ncbi:MAG: hypothetical protein A2V88_08785 [Elusimicrobia bacterium RBG_16_66_12]|nr:MAG: hypothetical protein A2V88_08785 [Elusimicrobia bacterium RBG_16_66_12]
MGKEGNKMHELTGHTSAETAYTVDDYPYGFRLRTSIRYWIETKQAQGQRFVSQTLNPKTGRWNKLKAGTYSAITVMFADNEGHVHCDGLTGYSGAEDIDRVERTYALEGNREREIIRYMRAAHRAGERVTWSVSSHVCTGAGCTDPSHSEHRQTIKEQAAIMHAVTRDELWREMVAAIKGETYPEAAS